MSEELKPCVFCEHDGARVIAVDEVTDAGCEEATVPLYAASCPYCGARGPMALSEDEAVEAWNRRAELTWHDFADELPPVGASVLCRGRNGALYVGKPVTLKGNGTREVWVPRGDQYRTPEKWMEIEDAD